MILRLAMLVWAALAGGLAVMLGAWRLQPLLLDTFSRWRAAVEWQGLDSLQVAERIGRLQSEVALLRAENQRLQKAAEMRLPRGPYIVVDTHTNTLLVRDGQHILRQAICSTGSGSELVVGRRRWVFETPKGQFKVLGKQYLPVWVKPDWAFYEEGKKPPPPGSPLRFQQAVLGEYALGFGDGYMIHGTLYKRLLGQKITHGCIRLDDEDLRFVYDTARIGTPIHIF